MPSAANVKGALLEEVILHLLSKSGYRTVQNAGTDRTLRSRNRMLWVRGRGEWHQIDAIADFVFSPPFSNPQRLLVEGKCEARPVGLGIARNSVGVLKDVSEFFVPDPQANRLLRQRYHYQCAIFSGSGFTPQSQNYSYAHDIFLLDLSAGAFRQIVAALNRIRPEDVDPEVSIPDLRDLFRHHLQLNDGVARLSQQIETAMRTSLEVSERIGFVAIAMIGGVFPIFLVPESENVRDFLLRRDRVTCRIRITENEFRFESGNQVLFRFAIPDILFKKCFDEGEFDQAAALDVKEQYLDHLEVRLFSEFNMHRCVLDLDRDWLDQIRNSL